jgi:hypothetical protein
MPPGDKAPATTAQQIEQGLAHPHRVLHCRWKLGDGEPRRLQVVMLRRLDWHELGQRESAEQWQAMGGEAIVNEPKSRHA